jgi:hypothetical protein
MDQAEARGQAKAARIGHAHARHGALKQALSRGRRIAGAGRRFFGGGGSRGLCRGGLGSRGFAAAGADAGGLPLAMLAICTAVLGVRAVVRLPWRRCAQE